MEPTALAAFLDAWGYPTLLLLLILTGLGSPVPEDLLLLTTGYLISIEVFQWGPALTVCVLGVVASDVILFVAGRHIGWHVGRQHTPRLLSPERLHRVTQWFARRGDALVFIARLVPGTRALVFVAAGARAMDIRQFLRYDVMGALVWVPATLGAGHAMRRWIGDVSVLSDRISGGVHWMIAVVALVLLIWLAMGREESKL